MAVKRTTEPLGETKETAFSAKQKPDGDTAGFCVYIGPTITGVIQAGTIYPGGVEQAAQRISPAVQRHPLIAALIVPGETLSVDRIKVKTPGNLLNVNYRKLASGKHD